MDTQILEDIGLTNAEIKVYLALLELGSATAGPIIERSGLQSSVVHTTLAKLVAKGLASGILDGKRHHYQASEPQHMLDFVDEKRERLQKTLPELQARQLLAKRKPEVVAFRGIRGIKALLLELLDAGGKEHLTLGSCTQSLMLGETWWLRYHTQRVKQGIIAKQIFNDSLRGWASKNYDKLSEMRFLQAGFEPLTEIIIRDGKVAVIVWSTSPLGILIEQDEAARSYEQYFRALWRTAKK